VRKHVQAGAGNEVHRRTVALGRRGEGPGRARRAFQATIRSSAKTRPSQQTHHLRLMRHAPVLLSFACAMLLKQAAAPAGSRPPH
jgi:hypothetical protein